MPARHRSRQRALQVLFLWDQRKQPIEEAIDSYYVSLGSGDEDVTPAAPDQFMETLVRGASQDTAEIDARIAGKSQNWRLDRMAAVDRNILRLAVYEMKHLDTPPAVVIDEALELARQFSGDESVSFINGVLDAVRRGEHDAVRRDGAKPDDAKPDDAKPDEAKPDEAKPDDTGAEARGQT